MTDVSPTEAEATEDAPTAPDDIVGHADGEVVTAPDGTDEKIVHEFDADGAFVGWHKEGVA